MNVIHDTSLEEPEEIEVAAEPDMTIGAVDEYPVVASIRTHVIKYGDITPENTHAIIMIPGTPGAVSFTKEFMGTIHHCTGLPVWGLSYAGQSRVPSSISWEDPDPSVFTLQGQIDHKLSFVFEHVPRHVQLILIGHSFGAYMILEMLRNTRLSPRVSKSMLLFPAIERMVETERGQAVLDSLHSRKRYMGLAFARVASWVPRAMRFKALEYMARRRARTVDVSDAFKQAAVDILDPWCLGKVFHLVEEQLRVVKELDVEHVRKHVNKIIFYYGATDWWAPKEYYEDMRKRFPGKEDIYLCTEGFMHAFVVNASVPMGRKVSGWVEQIVETERSNQVSL